MPYQRTFISRCSFNAVVAILLLLSLALLPLAVMGDEIPVENEPFPPLTPVHPHEGLEEMQLDFSDLQLASPNVIVREFFGDGTYRDYHREMAGDPIYPASMTKMMSVLVILRRLRSLGYTMHDVLEVQMEDVQGLATSGASIMGLLIGELIPVRELLYGVLLPSGSDALRTLVRHVADSDEEFVTYMNDAAKELGMNGTHFANYTGLFDPYNYSTPEDMTLLMHCLLQDPLYRQIISTRRYTTPPTNMHSAGLTLEHTLQYYGDKLGIDNSNIGGGKTGWLPESGHNFTSFQMFGDRLIIVSTERARKEGQQIEDHAKIYGYLSEQLPALPKGLTIPSPEERWPDVEDPVDAGLEQAGPLKPPRPEIVEETKPLEPPILETMTSEERLAAEKARTRERYTKIALMIVPLLVVTVVIVFIERQRRRRRYRPTKKL